MRGAGGKTSHKDVAIRRSIEKSYFGNMVRLDRNANTEQKIAAVQAAYKETVLYPDGISLTITCFISSLQNAIYQHIVSFFLLHNFGTRHNKGFGSFSVTKCNGEVMKYNPSELLKKECPFPIYTVTNSDSQSLLRFVNELYKLMKSGVNQQGDYFRAFIYQYIHRNTNNTIGNEKAWLKRTGIAPIVGKTVNANKHENNKAHDVSEEKYRYVRAMLGIGDGVTYINRVDQATGRPDFAMGKTQVSISHTVNGRKVEGFRYASPIVFKITKRMLFILPYPVDTRIFGKEFSFSSKNGSGTIHALAEFDMDDFMRQFAAYINSDCDPTRYDTNKRLSDTRSLSFRGRLKEV